jgi:hypothetical protein
VAVQDYCGHPLPQLLRFSTAGQYSRLRQKKQGRSSVICFSKTARKKGRQLPEFWSGGCPDETEDLVTPTRIYEGGISKSRPTVKPNRLEPLLPALETNLLTTRRQHFSNTHFVICQARFSLFLFPGREFRRSKATQPFVARQLHIPGHIRLRHGHRNLMQQPVLNTLEKRASFTLITAITQSERH